jgi:hypothetical protein
MCEVWCVVRPHDDCGPTPHSVATASPCCVSCDVRAANPQVTYPLHIILRYELEKGLVEGERAQAHACRPHKTHEQGVRTPCMAQRYRCCRCDAAVAVLSHPRNRGRTAVPRPQLPSRAPVVARFSSHL